MERYIIVAEKPSVARNLKQFFRYNKIDAMVTAAKGHIMKLDFPKKFSWGLVDPLKLFDVAGEIRLYIKDKKTYNLLSSIFRRYRDRVLVIATDNDSEGELIGYEILRIYWSIRGDKAKYYRMRFNSLEFNELRKSWLYKESSLNWNMVNKALFRAYFDLVTGAAFTRLLTEEGRKHKYVKLLSWGSCQTPTLYYVVERERERLRFKREKYWYLEGIFEYRGASFSARTLNIKESSRAREYYNRVHGIKEGVVDDYNLVKFIDKRPLPLMTDYMLRDLVRVTNKSASQILSIAEELYSLGFISYPRTETDKYPKNFDFLRVREAVLKSSLRSEIEPYVKYKPDPRNGRRDDKAHPPIYPVKPYPRDNTLKWIVWEYVARRYMANVFSEDAFGFRQKISIDVNDVQFIAHGLYYAKYGYRRIYSYFKYKENPLPRLGIGEKVNVIEISIKTGYTNPPARLSESDLLAMMEKDGIGTDATRALYPKLISDRKYAIKKKGRFIPTLLGMKFIEALERIDKRLVTPQTRKYVEELMNKVGEGATSFEEALKESLANYKALFKELMNNIESVSKILSEGLLEDNSKK